MLNLRLTGTAYRIAASSVLALTALAAPLSAQRSIDTSRLSAAQIELLRQDPELVRDYIRRSGLSPDEIRRQLRAAGFSETLLDTYLTAGGADLSGASPTLQQLSAIEALGLPFTLAERALPVDTGFVARGGARSRVFGVDAFRRSTTQFLPLLSGPVPPDYRLGPGDVLVLLLTGDVELAHTLTVSREGFLLIPQVGQLYVANLTLDQLNDLLFSRLGRVYSGVRRRNPTTTFDVSVANVRVNQVFVIGEVMQPGAYQLSALGSALSGLYAAGGVTEDASLRAIEVRRNDETVATLDLYDYLLRGDARNDLRLETGDVVFVPVRGARISVVGAVVRPGIYEPRAGESLADMVAAAGGFHSRADLRRLTVHRVLPPGERGPGAALRAAIDVELLAVDSAGLRSAAVAMVPPFALRDGDSVVVHELPPVGSLYFVRVAGMVRRPGIFPWRPGITLRDLILLAGGPTVGADLREAEIARMPVDRTGGQLAEVIRAPMDSSYITERDAQGRYAGPPGPAFPPAGSAPPVPLEPYDQVLILRQPEFELQRTVAITGEVSFPGAYTLTQKSNRMSDLIQRAGGLLPTAYAEGARFIRPLNDAGRVGVDLPAVLRDPGGRLDIVLQPGDSLDVPEYNPTVQVLGAVNSPSSVLYRQGEGLGYYIENAGGYAHNADKGRVSVRYANGSARVRSRFLFFSSSPTPGPGSTVFVPAEAEGGGVNATQLLAAVAQILASTVAIIVVATR